MKNKNLLRAVAIVVIAALSLSFFLACEPTDDNNTNDINLANTEWKLIAFVDITNDTSITPTLLPYDNDTYTLNFTNDTLLKGRSSSNYLGGHYKVYQNDSISLKVAQQTFALEINEGNLFVESLNNVSSYHISDNSLKLYYNNRHNYLKFERR
jgi:hypothetical protein